MTKNVQIEKLSMEIKPYDKVLEKVMELCPAAVQNGKVDFERLKTELADVVDKNTYETYEFKWVGKNNAIVEANKPIRKTLRPCKEESKNWDMTENLYIEGDNLEVLKLLEEGYLRKVKMIYIDPPYNTGKDSFVFRDNRTQSEEEMNEGIGLFDEEGNRQLSKSFIKNTETGGRFHSRWCSMIYPCLKLARDLLTDDGVIFISIDDHEVANLKKICDEIFGEGNFLYQLSVVNNLNGNDNSSGMMETQEYCFLYAKNKAQAIIGVLPLDDEDSSDWQIDEFGYWKVGRCLKATGINAPREARPNLFFPVFINEETLEFTVDEKVGTEWYHLIPLTEGKEMRWYWSKETFINEHNEVIVKKTNEGYSLYKKQRPSLGDMPSKRGKTTFYSPKYANANSNAEIKRLFEGKKLFDYSKATQLIKDFVCIGNVSKEDIILDFFSGSATTAHAVMQLNAEDGGKRKFIMVQLPELTDEKSEAFKAGYKNICEIGKERIRRAGEKIKTEHPEAKDLDIGFRVLKVDESNIQDIYYNPSELKKSDLLSSVDNIKPDRTPLDLLFGIMVKWGVSLSLPLQEVNVGKNTIHIVGDNDLVACFDTNVSATTITKMAELNPTRVVFRDSCFEKDDEKINMFEIFKTICHWDDQQARNNVKVI